MILIKFLSSSLFTFLRSRKFQSLKESMLLCGFVEQKLSFSALVDRNIIDFIIHFAVLGSVLDLGIFITRWYLGIYVDHLDKSQVQALGALGLGHNHCGFPNSKSILVYAGI